MVTPALQDRAGRPIAARPVFPEAQPSLVAPGYPALEAAREIHLHLNVSRDQLAAILRHCTGEDNCSESPRGSGFRLGPARPGWSRPGWSISRVLRPGEGSSKHQMPYRAPTSNVPIRLATSAQQGAR